MKVEKNNGKETENETENKEEEDDLSIISGEQEWREEHERILVEWADKAMCYRWLHGKSHQMYSKKNAWYTIPVIIMSTLTGTANFAAERVPETYRGYFSMGVGGVNIVAGIITTVQQFLKVGELNESHRVSSIAWDKFYRNIKVELAKSRQERMHVSHMLKMCKEEFDRLMETCPTIDEKIILQFNKTFPTTKNIKPNNNVIKPDIKRPEICDELISTAEIVYIPPKESVERKQNKLVELAKRKDEILKNQEQDVEKFILSFEVKHKRKPMDTEIHDNMADEINPDILDKIITKFKKEENV
jgi:hypothetical protein